MVKTEKNTLTVIDTWVWIAPENIDKIFNRLYREDDSRSMAGYGIGLSMVKKIADVNNWKLLVRSEKWNGTRFEITF
jgi:signal transduction histidine kinase